MRERDAPLVSVDDDVIALLANRGANIGSVRGSHALFSHRECRSNISVQKGSEPFLLLLFGTVASEDFHVACVGGGAVHGLWSNLTGATHDLSHDGVLRKVNSGIARQ